MINIPIIGLTFIITFKEFNEIQLENVANKINKIKVLLYKVICIKMLQVNNIQDLNLLRVV
jgi:hypothetical protein